jgi:hypothetical protein
MAARKIQGKSTDVLIRNILDQNGWSLNILAELIGVSKAKMAMCLWGGADYAREANCDLAKALGR